MASEGNMDNIRKMVLEQMKSNDPETGLPYTHDFWLSTSLMWIRFHHVPRSTMFVPTEVELQDGPPQEELGNGRMTMVLTDAGDQWHEGTWDFNDSNAKRDIGVTFTGATCFERKEHEMFEPLPERRCPGACCSRTFAAKAAYGIGACRTLTYAPSVS